jgi:hypothetical protein
VADEAALGLGPRDLVGFDPQQAPFPVIDKERGGVVVVKELVKSVEDLICQIPRAELGDDLLLDAVEDAGEALVFPAGEVALRGSPRGD